MAVSPVFIIFVFLLLAGLGVTAFAIKMNAAREAAGLNKVRQAMIA